MLCLSAACHQRRKLRTTHHPAAFLAARQKVGATERVDRLEKQIIKVIGGEHLART